MTSAKPGVTLNEIRDSFRDRLVDAAPHGHWRITTVMAGPRGAAVVSPVVLDGPTTGPALLACFE